MDIQYTERLEKIEAQLRRWLPENPDFGWLENVLHLPKDNINPDLIKGLTLPAWDLVNRGGKRWRPLLMLLVAEALAGEQGAEAAIPLTPLVEFSHNASLIHDDIEDSSDERRGKPAVHLLYGNDIAINSGTFLYLLPLACLSASAFSEQEKNQIYALWGLYLQRLHLGQAMDIAWHRDFGSLPSFLEYERMCSLKTGCLARMAAVLGVYCAVFGSKSLGQNTTDRNTINDFAEKLGAGAEKLGIGFQILDDVKNLSTGIPGKKRGDDIVEGKKSLPILLYLHRYPEKQDFVASCFKAARNAGIGAPELEQLIKALELSGVLEEAGNKGKQYIEESRAVFTELPPAGKGRTHTTNSELLGGLIDFIS